MSTDGAFLGLILVVAAGTYLTRYLPFYLTRKLPASMQHTGWFKRYLQHVSPAIIAALLVVSFDPATMTEPRLFFGTLAGLVSTAVSWWYWRNTGLAVFAGIAAFAVILLWF